MKGRILIIEDEIEIVDLVAYNLAQSGFAVESAGDGISGLEKAREGRSSLVILDLMLPLMDGLEVCRLIRSDSRLGRLPVIMLTSRTAEMDRVLGLEIGADDYVTKPFSPRELVLRVKKLLQQTSVPPAHNEVYRIGILSMDVSRHSVEVEGTPVELTATEFRLLQTLMERRDCVQTRESLLCDIWVLDKKLDPRTVDTHMRRLREKLGASGAPYLDTVRGVGYRLLEP